VTFQTKCNNNLAIDYADQNFFASSALDHPGVMIWDRRATARPVASHTYLQAVEEDELPWGGALRLDQVIETDSDPLMAEGKHSLIRSLRYCRDRRGLLAALSPTGQLKVLETNKETPPSGTAPQGPELLQVQRSYEMDVSYRDNSRRNDRIVSFDWMTLGSPALRPRLLVLRANGNFDVLEQPSRTSDHVFNFIPWQAPYRGLEGTPSVRTYCASSNETQKAAPTWTFLAEQTLSEVPIFGPDSSNVEERLVAALRNSPVTSTKAEQLNKITTPLPEAFNQATSVAQKLRILRAYVRQESESAHHAEDGTSRNGDTNHLGNGPNEISLASNSLGSCREIHEGLLTTLVAAKGLPRQALCVVDHIMPLRAKEKYLFDAAENRSVIGDDPWKRFIWDWIAGRSSR